MNYQNFTTGFNKPAIFTAQTYGTKTTVEIDHSDLSLDEVMDAFQTLLNGMGYHSDGFKQWVLERAAEYQEEENEKWNDAITSMEQDEDRYENLRHNWEDESILTSEKDAEVFFEAINGSIEPNEKLKEAVKEFRKVIKKRKPKSAKDIEDEFELGGNE